MDMPAPTDYLASLQKKGVRIWIDNGQVRYHANKGVLSAEDMARLRGMKDDIVTGLIKLPGVPTQYTGLQSRVGSLPAPVSFQQEWLLSLIEKRGNWGPAQAFAFHITGLLQTQILENSIDVILRRHDALRSRVLNVHGRRWLEIDAPCNYQLDIVPVPDTFTAEETSNVRFYSADLVARCADPAIGPAVHFRLLRISDREHYLLLAVQRLAADCMSIGQVFRELWLQYGEELRARSPQFSGPPGQYRDYTTWQQGGNTQWHLKHGAFWQEYLHDATPVRWRTDGSISCGKCGLTSLQGSFGTELSARLRELGRQTRSLPALVMLTLYVSVVSRWCGQWDLVVPFNVAGRQAAHDSVVGCFSHVLYLRVRLQADEPFAERLRLVSGEFYKAVFHQDLGRMALGRPDLLRGTFCQWLSWHPAELAGREMYEVPRQLGISARPVHFQTAQDFSNMPAGVTELDATFFESSGDIGMLLIFPRNVLAESTVEQLIRELRALAEQVVDESVRS